MISQDDFGVFFEALWGYPPFPWQEKLARQVAEGDWPDTLDLPTGAGKTAALDVATFSMALCAAKGTRPAFRRAVMVVDRRVIVDQGYVRARKISDALEEAQAGILVEVREALRSLHGGQGSESSLGVAILRGAMVRDGDWARSPDQPLLMVSTVDQVGSRLLFRGYGLSSRMAPVHAGLLGTDTLYLLDEVHLSRPFEQTLSAIGRYAESPLVERRIAPGPTVVRMSATVGAKAGRRLALGDADREHPVLAKRLRSRKRVRLLEPIKAPADEAKARSKIAQAADAAAKALFERDFVQVAAVIVNRVATAREVATLAQRWASSRSIDVVLLTGRMRPLDRRRVMETLQDRVISGRGRPALQPTLVVSTQAIEAGADFDFDAMVSECASLDALRQRFGRVDRLGHLQGEGCGVVLATQHQVKEGASDPIYGESLSQTWAFLQARAEDGELDFGTDAQSRWEFPPAVLAPYRSAPALLPTYLDLWVQTEPKPPVEPDVAVFLHGGEREASDVNLVWRGDIEEELREGRLDVLRTKLMACPPSALEALPVPVWAAQAWLRAIAAPERAGAIPAVSDVDAEAMVDAPRIEGESGPLLLWRGEESRLAVARELSPGDTVVVPARYGGIAHGNWDPESREAVRDRGDEAQMLHRGRVVLRLDRIEEVSGGRLRAPELGDPDGGEERALSDAERRDQVMNWAREHAADSALESWLRLALEAVGKRAQLVHARRWCAALGWRPLSAKQLRGLLFDGEVAGAWSEDEGSSFTGVATPLPTHLSGVGQLAGEFAKRLALPEETAADVALAGRLHDLGKADPRFQCMLHGGDEVSAAVATEHLAKSGVGRSDRAARARARERSGYPVGQRHELLSLALVEESAFRSQASDWDLVLHLVASHHGYCRPFAPVENDPRPCSVSVDWEGAHLEAGSDHGLARLDSGVAERFWTLVRRYGWHGLALLEAVLRLADHRQSESEERDG